MDESEELDPPAESEKVEASEKYKESQESEE